MRVFWAGIVVLVTALSAAPANAQDPPDDAVPVEFVGRVVVEFLADGRRAQLLEPYSYIDPAGETWDVPAGAIVDGASIPQAFWTIIGGPFEGKYRNASVLHDYYSEQKNRPWQAVHRMFYDAMRESEVDELLAKVMYYAVYFFGPRWEAAPVQVRLVCTDSEDGETCQVVVEATPEPVPIPAAVYDADAVRADLDAILKGNPSLDEIEAMVPVVGQ